MSTKSLGLRSHTSAGLLHPGLVAVYPWLLLLQAWHQHWGLVTSCHDTTPHHAPLPPCVYKTSQILFIVFLTALTYLPSRFGIPLKIVKFDMVVCVVLQQRWDGQLPTMWWPNENEKNVVVHFANSVPKIEQKLFLTMESTHWKRKQCLLDKPCSWQIKILPP